MTLNIRLFQIDEERDNNNAAFQDFSVMQASGMDERIYDMTWAGLFETQQTDMEDSLEDLFARFQNASKPADLKTPMHVSDVVEVEAAGGSQFFYADLDGFHEIEFESSLAESKYNQKLDVVLVEPGKYAKPGVMPADLKSMQEYVGGYIQILYPYDEYVCIVCGEESKLQGLPPNRGLTDSAGELYDIICGKFFLCSCKGDNLTSLNRTELRHYTDLFKKPECFFRTADGIKAVPYDLKEHHKHNAR